MEAKKLPVFLIKPEDHFCVSMGTICEIKSIEWILDNRYATIVFEREGEIITRDIPYWDQVPVIEKVNI